MKVLSLLSHAILAGIAKTALDAPLAWPFIACVLLVNLARKADVPLRKQQH